MGGARNATMSEVAIQIVVKNAWTNSQSQGKMHHLCEVKTTVYLTLMFIVMRKWTFALWNISRQWVVRMDERTLISA